MIKQLGGAAERERERKMRRGGVEERCEERGREQKRREEGQNRIAEVRKKGSSGVITDI